MDKTLVAGLGVEGGDCSIYVRRGDGDWSYWQDGSSVDFADDDVVRRWPSEPVADLGLAMPREWPLFHVLEIHPDFLGWFREHYEEARASLPHDMREMQVDFLHRRWAETLGI